MLSFGELLDHALIELAALRRKRDHPVLRKPAVHGFECRSDDVDPEHHARAAAVGLVVHLPAGEPRPVPVVEETEIQLAAENGRKRPLLRHRCENMGNQGEDVDAQSPGRLVVRCEPSRHQDSPPHEVDLSDAGADHWERKSGVELEDVVGHAGCNLGHRAEQAAAIFLDLQAD